MKQSLSKIFVIFGVLFVLCREALLDTSAADRGYRRNASGNPPSTGITCPVVLAL